MPVPQPWRAGKREGDAGPRPDADGMDAGVPEGGPWHWPPSLYFCLFFCLCPITSDSAPRWLRNVKTAKDEIKQKRKTRKRG